MRPQATAGMGELGTWGQVSEVATGDDPDLIYESADSSRSPHTCEHDFLSVWAVVCLHLVEIEIEVAKVSIKASEICVSSTTNN